MGMWFTALIATIAMIIWGGIWIMLTPTKERKQQSVSIMLFIGFAAIMMFYLAAKYDIPYTF